jgi:hypothetical protein
MGTGRGDFFVSDMALALQAGELDMGFGIPVEAIPRITSPRFRLAEGRIVFSEFHNCPPFSVS